MNISDLKPMLIPAAVIIAIASGGVDTTKVYDNIQQIKQPQTIQEGCWADPADQQQVCGLDAPSEMGASHVPATSNGNHQPSPEIVDAVQKHFGDMGPKVITEALQIARCESSYNPKAHNTKLNKGWVSGDRGLFQINYVHDDWLRSLGYSLPNDLWDVDTNTEIARKLVDRRISKGDHMWEDWKQSRKCHKI